MPLRRRVGLVVLAIGFLAACGGTGSTGPGGGGTVASVSLSPALLTIDPNTPTPIQATLRAANGQVLTGRSCTWSSSDPAVLSVSSSGGDEAIMTGLKAGTVIVTASCQGQRATATITVRPVPVASIVITPDPAAVEVAKTLQLSAVVRDARGNPLARTVTWSSAAPGTATIDASTGLLTGVSAGTVEISATADGFTTRVTVTVKPKPVARIVVNPTELEIYVGHAATFTATAYAADGEVLRRGFFTWSANPTAPLHQNMVVSGSERQTAQVYGTAEGSTTLTATLEGVSGSAKLGVKALPATAGSISLSPVRTAFTGTTGSSGGFQTLACKMEWTAAIPAGESGTWTGVPYTGTLEGGKTFSGNLALTSSFTAGTRTFSSTWTSQGLSAGPRFTISLHHTYLNAAGQAQSTAPITMSCEPPSATTPPPTSPPPPGESGQCDKPGLTLIAVGSEKICLSRQVPGYTVAGTYSTEGGGTTYRTQLNADGTGSTENDEMWNAASPNTPTQEPRTQFTAWGVRVQMNGDPMKVQSTAAGEMHHLYYKRANRDWSTTSLTIVYADKRMIIASYRIKR